MDEIMRDLDRSTAYRRAEADLDRTTVTDWIRYIEDDLRATLRKNQRDNDRERR